MEKVKECGGCESESCQDCCPHEFDMDEGYMCLGCGKQGDIGRLTDWVMDTYEA